ncbi:MAG: amidohydrolase [Prevotellaceae bacterium]|jgi:amidohydrolase|nr:amidohydrolase [Prevotellaceae bacterium]
MITKDRILDLTRKNIKLVQNSYKRLHQYPELAFREYETSKYIREELKELDIPFREGYAKTGILGVLRCKNPQKRIVALRADIDALPVTEETDLPYKSHYEGVMHACGHDAHTASLLGVIHILNSLKDELEGTFLFLFQPAEEKFPGGAKTMLDENIFDGFTPDLVIAQHVSPLIEQGKVGFRSGLISAAVDEIYLTIHGEGGHAALLKDHNAVLASAVLLTRLQDIPAKLAPVKDETVLVFGRLIAEGAMNVIPRKVEIDGTMRTLDTKWRQEALDLLTGMVEKTVAEYGCTSEIKIVRSYPSVINDEQLTVRAEKYAVDFLGKENVITFEKQMTGEDFAYFSQLYPSLFYRVGTKNDRIKSGGLHSSVFAIDLDVLETTTATMAWLAVNFIEEK